MSRLPHVPALLPVRVRLTTAERSAVRRCARQSGMAVSRLVREIADQSAALAVFYDQTTPEAAEVVARKWRRNPIYLAALKQIGAS